METFTVRDLNRSAASVLAAAERDGVAVVRRRGGKAYEVRPRVESAPSAGWRTFLERRRRRRQELYSEGPIMTRKQAEAFDHQLADDGRLL